MIEWGTRGQASVLVGGQFGSEGKGLAAAWLAHQIRGPLSWATTNAGAQAGHTTISNGRRYVCYHLPTSAVELGVRAYVNAGSIIDVETLEAELMQTGFPPHLLTIHPRAAVITSEDKVTEKTGSTMKLASTQKGVGSAISNKIMRRAELAGDVLALANWIGRVDLNDRLLHLENVVVEVPQGTGLSINHGYRYPYVTSRDCWVGSGLSDAGIHPSFVRDICMVIRTMPIRVGHLYNEYGELLGESGPFYGDSRELNWENDLPGVEPERTTVTKRVRRIASWSDAQYGDGLVLNRPTIVFLNFVNYLNNSKALEELIRRMREIEQYVTVHPQHVFGFGPNVEDVTDDIDRAIFWFSERRL